MKKITMLLFLGIYFIPLVAHSDGVTIASIESPEFTEVQLQADGSWHVLSDLGQLAMPVQANWVEESKTELQIEINNQLYVISRADVQLGDEEIVTSACDTVPLSIANDSTSVSVKGAGESCN